MLTEVASLIGGNNLKVECIEAYCRRCLTFEETRFPWET